MTEHHKRSLAASTASMYELDEILEFWPLNISVALESTSLGHSHIFRCKESDLRSFDLKLLIRQSFT